MQYIRSNVNSHHREIQTTLIQSCMASRLLSFAFLAFERDMPGSCIILTRSCRIKEESKCCVILSEQKLG
jgi:hypothetical protein